MVTVMIVDDHAVVRSGLRAMLKPAAGRVEVVAEAGHIEDAERFLAEKRPDVLLLDVQLAGGESGLSLIPAAKVVSPKTAVIMMSAFLSPELLQRCLDEGVSGYLTKDTEDLDLPSAVVAVASGGKVFDKAVFKMQRRMTPGSVGNLTPREMDVLGLLCEGRSNADIAPRLRLTENAVKGFVSSIMRKLGCENRFQVVLKAKDEHLC